MEIILCVLLPGILPEEAFFVIVGKLFEPSCMIEAFWVRFLSVGKICLKEKEERHEKENVSCVGSDDGLDSLPKRMRREESGSYNGP
ncbi:MAG: hypothetical protein HFJ10_02140 [Lachnospiraceae bacterium]|nr:hypothetical protein [Lachnospiraceae bacterium]